MGNRAFKEPADIPENDRRGVFDGARADLSAVAKLIKSGRVKNCVVVCGAGISVSAGIPDFRSPGTGLYDNLQKYNLPDGRPEAVFEIEYFRERPEAFYSLARELFPGSFKPTVCHYFLKLLSEKGLVRRIYTQNIDCLERLAGIPDELVVPCHGNFDGAHCIECCRSIDPAWVKAHIMAGTVPRCSAAPGAADGDAGCDGLCKPAIVFFGEPLNSKFKEVRDGDLCLEIDTTSTIFFSPLSQRMLTAITGSMGRSQGP